MESSCSDCLDKDFRLKQIAQEAHTTAKDKGWWDIEKVMKAKMDYNKTRTYRHGGKKY